MKNHFSRIISLILAISMVFGLASCKGDSKDDPSKETETEKVDISAEIRKKFKSAADALGSIATLDLDITVDTKRQVGSDEYSEFSEIHIDYTGLGTETVTAAVKDKTVLDEAVITVDEIYSGGKIYAKYKDCDSTFVAELSLDDLYDRYVPAVIIDPELYTSISYSEKDKNTLIFDKAEELEEWVAPEYACLTEASAVAALDKDGKLERMEYTCSFIQGNACITSTYTVTPSEDSENTPPALPEESTLFESDNVDTLKYFLYVKDRINTTAAVIASESQEMAVASPEAVFVTMSISEAFNLYDKEGFQSAMADGSISAQDYEGSIHQEWTETFKDGKSYSSENGSEPAENSASFSDYRATIKNTALDYLPTDLRFTSISTESTDEFILINYSLDLSASDADFYNQYVCEMIYGDSAYLENNSDSYTTEKIGGYVAMDKDSLIPTAFAVEFSGKYADSQASVTVALAKQISIDIANDEAYTAVTDKYLPEEEPETKATPLFYTVTGENGEKMYLLGTIHLGDERTAYLPDEIYKSLDESDSLALEVNLATFEDRIVADSALLAQLQSSYYYLDGTTLKDHLPEELYAAAVSALKISGAYTPYSEITRPSILCSSLDYFLLDSSKEISSHKGVDWRLLRYANEKGISVIDVEKIEDRLNMDIRFSEKTQELLLADSLSSSRSESLEGTRHLFELWCEGDEEKLREYIREDAVIPEDITDEEKASLEEYNKIMVTERDEKMIAAAKEYLSGDKTVFFAVGLAHLLGDETGLVDALRDAGYTVELVEYK